MASSESLGIRGFLDSKWYEKVRPVYPKEAVQTLMVKLGVLKEDGEAYPDKTFNILELGAGTGKFTRVMVDVLKDANVRIIASDPIKNMCEQFKEVLPEIEMKQFPAENIGLEDGSVDAVVSANAFHWFADKKESFLEINRVLARKGMLGLIWSYPDGKSQPWMDEIWKYLDIVFLKQNVFGCHTLHEEKYFEVISRCEKFGTLEKVYLRNTLEYSSTSFFQLVSSFSVFQVADPQERAEYEKFVREVMKKHFGEDGKEPSVVNFVIPVYWCQKN